MEISSQFNTLLKNINPISSLISNDLLDILGVEDVANIFLDFNKVKNSVNPVEDTINFFTDLDKRLENVTDPGIIKGWIQKFASMPQDIIDGVLSKIPEPTFLNRTFSDSIGEIARVQNYRDESVLPPLNVADTVVGLIDTGMKLPAYLEENLNQLGQITTKLVNKNLSGIIGEVASSDIAHGANLVMDTLHLDRFTGIANDYLSKATGAFSGASNYVQQILKEVPFANSVASPVFDVIQKVEGLSVAINSAGQDIINLPKKAITLLQLPT